MEQKKERKLSFIYKFKYLLHSTREYRKYAYLSIGFVLVETILECIIPYIMSRLISLLQSFIGVEVTETLKQEALNGVIIYGSIFISFRDSIFNLWYFSRSDECNCFCRFC